MVVLRTVLSFLLLALFALAAIGNVTAVMQSFVTRKFVSMIPLVGGLAGAAGYLISSSPTVRDWWWVPLFADIGSLPLLLSTAAWLMWRRLKKEA